MEILLVLWLALIGLACGSFVNAYVYRVYTSEFAPKKKRTKLSILKGRSLCPSCKHVLAARDLVPLASWLQLRGKCRYCSTSISAQYPIIEIIGAILFVVQYFLWPFGFEGLYILLFAVWLTMNVLFLALVVADIKWMLLPDTILKPLAALLGAWVVILMTQQGSSVLLHALLSGLLFGGFFHVLYQVSGGRWIGGGDVKLGYLLGLMIIRPYHVMFVLFIASVLALAYYAAMAVIHKTNKDKIIPFGPFLIVAAVWVVVSMNYFSTWFDLYLFI